LQGSGNYTNPAMFSQFEYNSEWHNLLTETFPTIWQFLFLQIVKTKLKNYIREAREGKILLFTIVILNTLLYNTLKPIDTMYMENLNLNTYREFKNLNTDYRV